MMLLAVLAVAAVGLFIGWIMWDCDQDAEYWYQQSRRNDHEDNR